MDKSQSQLFNQIGTDLYDVEQIQQEIGAQKRRVSKSETGFVAPRTPTEEILAEIWVELLGFEQVGVHDSFFALGGHSLLVTQFLSRVYSIFQVELPQSVLFIDEFTIAELAKEIELHQIAQAGEEDIAKMLRVLEELSDDQVRALLTDQGLGQE